ncbi:metallophosphoesterase [Paracoccus sp. P2]|uniref:3',5'-cyclic AMP phosphodiesterase CpdA n=1 Tax=Paracoccus pantotrophus TaxID=82367 RepID=A0AAE6TVC6_PARPN|nr:metallophosphoesterase [Paracoccus pantotrophus]MDF3854674.1 metallophosphoesterase [Paracoccus pantotrophus]QFG38188.1 metallophosphoesterase [Paracoccus pantotrophus]RDD94324.1 metallophosphoesterase [Paracoccus pantotrophus]RKS51306.1 3',5'-cyclic AMP phosphodiesterase CpdA [Paracoccus pantotrophus]RNI19743.1 metallophosphoesterase [Paracoccus pantotrophus]
MTRILHLSDLHFGLERKPLVEPLIDRINAARADLVVVTGDLTHRGRSAQFAQAAAFLRRIEAPLLAVPGNHDIPLYKLADRMLRPWRRWRRAIAENLEPVGHVGTLRVQGVNSVDPMAWQRGIVTPAQVARVIAGLDPACINIVALHHPMQQRPQVDKALMQGAAPALAGFQAEGVQLVLSGHLHLWSIGAFLGKRGRPILQVQAGTALCDRPGDRQNEFAVLDFAGPDLLVERHVAPMTEPGFRPPEHLRFTRRDGLWRPA